MLLELVLTRSKGLLIEKFEDQKTKAGYAKALPEETKITYVI